MVSMPINYLVGALKFDSVISSANDLFSRGLIEMMDCASNNAMRKIPIKNLTGETQTDLPLNKTNLPFYHQLEKMEKQVVNKVDNESIFSK